MNRAAASDGRGIADLHVHSMASDGVDGVEAILDAAVALGLNVLAITDHERIDAAVEAQRIALARGLPLEVIVGEEITTQLDYKPAELWLLEHVRPKLACQP